MDPSYSHIVQSSPSHSRGWPLLEHSAHLGHLHNRSYYIVNVANNTYAALLSDTDRLEVVNITFNLKDSVNRGSQVPPLSNCTTLY